MRTTDRTTKRRQVFPWMAGALALVSVGVVACDHGWIWEGADNGPPSATGGMIGGGATGGAVGADAGYGGAGTGGINEPYADAGCGTGGNAIRVLGTGGTPELGGTGGTVGVGCFTVTLEHVLCEGIDLAKEQASADCQQNGLDLITFGPAADCRTGVGDQRAISYTCCPHTDSAPPSYDPASCRGRVVGDSQTCQSDLALEGLAVTDCQALNADVTDAQPFTACGGDGHMYLSYECCTRDGSAIPLPQPDQQP